MLPVIPAINGGYTVKEGNFVLPAHVTLSTPFSETNSVFTERLKRIETYEVTACEGSVDAVIDFCEDKTLPEEAYRLVMETEEITVYASGEHGYSNALVTFYQLLAAGKGSVSCGTISDAPKYGRRGFMLDVCRHFFSVDEVKKVLEQCALLKINSFHWHLSEDQGYRIESKRFPELNEVASYRKLAADDAMVKQGFAKEGERYGGYYTHEEIREVIEYARVRQIEVYPEIDLPGHSTAVISKYPQYSCSGEPVDVANDFGIFPRIFCAGKEETYQFLFELLDEVCELFPSPLVHLGGDEAPKDEWKNCPDCSRVMKEQGFTDYEELQAYFTERMINHLKKKGKTAIVWNDAVASGNLEETSIIQHWSEWGDAESYVLPEHKKGRKLILSSMMSFYFDYPYPQIPMKATYLYEPELKGTPISGDNILGIEAPMWTEWRPSDEDGKADLSETDRTCGKRVDQQT